MSRFQQAAAQSPPDAQFPKLIAFLKFWKWVFPYLHDFVHRNASYRTYSDGQTGVFSIVPSDSSSTRIAVAADWGTGTLEADIVAQNMQACSPHYTLHLGDVYYMGETGEIAENCLGEPTSQYSGVLWPKGSLGSFALMGNHEMYSGGQGYFTRFLCGLGLLDANRRIRSPQSASFYCLEAEHWPILGLDTGYHSGGVPGLNTIPNAIPFLNVDARFDDEMLVWLRKTIEASRARSGRQKAILILTHHQPVSSFEHTFEKPATQLAQMEFLKGQELVWLYGHEHRLTVYKQRTIANSLNAYPRCIGHGGMPVEVTKLSRPDSSILYYDPRQHAIDDQDPDTRVGYNGHAVLILEGVNLTIEYRDIVKNSLLLTETFTVQLPGKLQYSSRRPETSPLLSGEKTN